MPVPEDHKLAIYYSPTFLEHKAPPGHPEKEERLTTIIDTLKNHDFFGLPLIEPREATTLELELVHTKDHIQRVKEASSSSSYLDPDTYASQGSFKAAATAAGAVIQATEQLSTGKLSRAFGLLRPPGHHASANQAMGFCLFNNVAIGAAYYVKNYGKRVAILDFDAHHGNGTQSIFYTSDDVLYCSWHQWPHYPGTGAQAEKGEGKGEGFTINIPLTLRSSDDVFIQSLDDTVLPALEKFKPGLVIVSAGFDSHQADPLSGLCFTEEGYATFTSRLTCFCRQSSTGLLFCLEGGYNLRALSNSILKTLAVLADKKVDGIDKRAFS